MKVTCIMPTANRRRFVPLAIRYFLAQDYADRELVILDDGDDEVSDLIPAHPQLRYIRHQARQPVGAKRNLACEAACGEIIAHWDDDDWYSPSRLSRQVAALLASGADICGLDRVLFVNPTAGRAWEYVYPQGSTAWVCGGTLCYQKAFWRRNPFPNINVGEDTRFVFGARTARIQALPDRDIFVGLIHEANTSPKRTNDGRWRQISIETVKDAVGSDWANYPSGDDEAKERPAQSRGAKTAGVVTPHAGNAAPGAGERQDATPRVAANTSASPDGLSVVVPFSGRQRLSLLGATLAGLRQSRAVDQLIVAEMGNEPVALDAARRWDADHVFIVATGAFDKARTLNVGSLLARRPELLWCDGDLLFGDDFLTKAQQEFRIGRFDFLFPFSRIEYLDGAQTREVLAGTRSPADCRPIRVLAPMRGGAIGGVGLVRAEFLQRHGGMVEGFLGWGGEDNAWVKKVSLLGRVGVTRHADQVAWHLYHPDSGATGGEPWHNNPHYARNLELLGRIARIATANEFVQGFPRPQYASSPWPAESQIAFTVATGTHDSATQAIAATWAQCTNRAFGTVVQVVDADAERLPATLAGMRANAVVVFADAAAARALAETTHTRPTVLVPAETETDVDWPAACGGKCWVLARTPEQVALWRRRGVMVWHRAWDDPPFDEGTIPVAVQPLSHLLSAPAVTPPASRHSMTSAGIQFPVWSYWEGPMPEWIALCLRTARRHAPAMRVLGPDDFDALWDRDRDIDLTKLHVAQRADFVRAFLLMRFGGLWIDADCIVMRDLSPLLAQLGEFDVIAHRERQGFFSNAFFAARPGSGIVARFYDAVCSRLRSRRRLGWIALGNEPLTEVLQSAPELKLELRAEEVQPVCWSKPEIYFRQAEDAEHERSTDSNAWCYMLSQQNVIHYQRSKSPSELTAQRTFFSFLIRRALADVSTSRPSAPSPRGVADEIDMPAGRPAPADLREAFARVCIQHSAEGHESISGPGSSMKQTAEIRRQLPLLLQSLDARVFLDAPCGDFHWMAKVCLGVESYIGVDLLEDQIRRNCERHMAPGRQFLARNILADPLPKADVVLCRDCLGHFSSSDIMRALRTFVASGSRYLLTTTFPGRSTNADIKTGQWRPLNLQARPFLLPAPLQIINEKCSESSGAFSDKSLGLWRLADLPLPELALSAAHRNDLF